jgi:hypothetical protein
VRLRTNEVNPWPCEHDVEISTSSAVAGWRSAPRRWLLWFALCLNAAVLAATVWARVRRKRSEAWTKRAERRHVNALSADWIRRGTRRKTVDLYILLTCFRFSEARRVGTSLMERRMQ